MRRAVAALLAAAVLLAGCSKGDDLRRYAVVRRADVWQAVITDADRGRLARLSDAWMQAQADVAAAGADVGVLGALAVPGARDSTRQLPTAGAYRCRIVHMGWRQGQPQNVPAVQVGDFGPCTLAADGTLLRFDFPAGVQRHVGALYPDIDRLIYLGSVQLAGEPRRRPYGEDRDRDQLGVLEPLAPGQWRIAMPWPRWTARLTLIELRAG
ncbi:DUF4893 domain-containing protein [Sandarakinorhabdus rubra]|uniref:DUF4893 domain-containing protein n=1 Tax=Sandarakinorhabdus rubra TaxID=2672568 RepID=UPI0013DA59B0|nr:DUF4893 domain-containing protein [Sandarakinorhabdus rubra]